MKSSETMSVPGQASIVLLGRAMLSLLAAVAIPLQFLLSQTLELAGEWELSLDPENAGGPGQLRRSLERYMASDAFDPEATLSARQLERFFEQQ